NDITSCRTIGYPRATSTRITAGASRIAGARRSERGRSGGLDRAETAVVPRADTRSSWYEVKAGSRTIGTGRGRDGQESAERISCRVALYFSAVASTSFPWASSVNRSRTTLLLMATPHCGVLGVSLEFVTMSVEISPKGPSTESP